MGVLGDILVIILPFTIAFFISYLFRRVSDSPKTPNQDYLKKMQQSADLSRIIWNQTIESFPYIKATQEIALYFEEIESYPLPEDEEFVGNEAYYLLPFFYLSPQIKKGMLGDSPYDLIKESTKASFQEAASEGKPVLLCLTDRILFLSVLSSMHAIHNSDVVNGDALSVMQKIQALQPEIEKTLFSLALPDEETCRSEAAKLDMTYYQYVRYKNDKSFEYFKSENLEKGFIKIDLDVESIFEDGQWRDYLAGCEL